MRRLGLCSIALLSALCASDPYWSFTQDTELDSSYSSLAPSPVANQPLTWGEVIGGSKDAPITLKTQQSLRVGPITHTQGEASGLFVDWGSHVKLVGDLSFESIVSSMGATGIVTGLRSSVNNEAKLTFEKIESGADMAMGIFTSLLLQKGTLHFKSIKSGDFGAGVVAGKFDSQANSSITLDRLESSNSTKALILFLARNSGSITLGEVIGGESVGLDSLAFLNEGKIDIAKIQANTQAIGVDAWYFINTGTLKVQTITSQGNSVGIKGELGNAGEINFAEIYAKNEAKGADVEEMLNSKTISFGKIKSDNLAIGIDAHEFSNDQGAQISVDLVEGANQAIGLKTFVTSWNEGEIRFKSITSNKKAIGLYGELSAAKGSSAVFESIQAPIAIGIYQDSLLQEVGGGGSIVFEKISGAESYGIFVDTKGSFYSSKGSDHSTIHFKNIQSNVGIKNLGKMQITQDSFVFAPSVSTKMDSAIYSDMSGGEFYLNTININTPHDYAFYAKQEAKVHIQASQASFGAGKYSFGGEVNLALSNQAEVTLQSGGTLKSLQSSHSKLILQNTGYSKRLTINDFQAQNNTFTLHVDFAKSQTGSYDGGEVYENGVKSTNALGSFLYIDSTKSTSKLENTLSISLDSKENIGKKYILLAQVVGANKDNIIFNSLSSGQTTSITTTGKYQTDTLLLGRYDDSSSNYYYLVADSFQAQESVTPKPPAPTPDPTPSQPTEEQQSHNALIFNPLEGIVLSTLDWSHARIAKLRDEYRLGRVWGELGGEFWKFNGEHACSESFVDLVLGGDYLFSFAKGKNALGVAVEFSAGFIDQYQVLGTEEYSLKINTSILSLALYDVLLLDNGFYSNLNAKVGGGSSEFDDLGSFAESVRDDSLMYFSVSEQVGQRLYFSSQPKGVFLDFSATVALGYTEGMKISKEIDSLPWEKQKGIAISTRPSFINQNTLEMLLGYRGEFNSLFSFDVNAGVGAVSNHHIGGEMRYEDQNGIYDFEGESYVGGLEVRANATGRIGDWVDLYVSVGSTWSKQYNEVIDFSAGIKLRFGTV